jgi:hypothetical protein
MARTAVPYSDLIPNGNLAQPAGTALDATNDHVIANAVPELTVLRVSNTDGSAHTLTIKAGEYPPAMAAGQGDLTVSIAATTGVQLIGPFESGRFIRRDGSMYIDVEASHAGTITALRIPRNT